MENRILKDAISKVAPSKSFDFRNNLDSKSQKSFSENGIINVLASVGSNMQFIDDKNEVKSRESNEVKDYKEFGNISHTRGDHSISNASQEQLIQKSSSNKENKISTDKNSQGSQSDKEWFQF